MQLRWRENAVAIANWDGACLADYAATNLTQQSILQDYVTSTWTYAHATVSFTRNPTIFMSNYFVPAVLLVFISYLGFFIDPIATPARVALGMLTMVVVMTNTVALSSRLPPSTTPSWLIRFLTISFYFNAVAMAEQIFVSFGNSLQKWQDAQFKQITANETWMEALGRLSRDARSTVEATIKGWHLDGHHQISKTQFRRGIREAFGFMAPEDQVNRLYDAIRKTSKGKLDAQR